MTYEHSFLKISAIGQLSNTEEIFATSFHAGYENNSISAPEWEALTPTVLNDIADAFGAFWSSNEARVPAPWILQTVKVAALNLEGKYIFEPKQVNGLNINGARVGQPFAAQLSLASTIVSGKWRDPGKYNRMYIPTIAVANPTSSLSETEQTGYLNAFKGMINDMNDALSTINPNVKVIVASNTSSGGSALYAKSVRVGRVIDTQRRRRNKLPENYAESAL